MKKLDGERVDLCWYNDHVIDGSIDRATLQRLFRAVVNEHCVD